MQAADTRARARLDHLVTIVGVNLVDFFGPTPLPGAALHLACASVTSWSPPRRFDLITCVHGLHYLGDKLAVLTRVAGWLTDDGRFIADLDLDGIRLPAGRPETGDRVPRGRLYRRHLPSRDRPERAR
ncbi:hypothetical protein [Micromonospora sp. MH33]|uniref:hypothetical protein n=1 Tax=Micromonospora sp. MH33 TaxID=1945509 RepID=UPI000D14B83D|nr:hypothetical protein [Micromonospora sp. MH33]